MHTARLAVAIAAVAAGCRLDPLVDDTPGASGHVLKADATVPDAADSPEIANQITLNDGIDDKLLAINGGVIPRGTGQSAGEQVRYWSFGFASRAPAPLFRFFERTAMGLRRLSSHPAMVESLPGERSYNPLHAINQVVVTARYNGELITSGDALADAIDLGLVEDPVPTGEFVTSPIVLPTTRLEISSKSAVPPLEPQRVFGHGYIVGMFELGGELGEQPIGGGFLPTRQVSFLRESSRPAYDATRPIFQVTEPTKRPVPPEEPNYTALSVVINVDLVPGMPATMITKDSDLFMRGPEGEITGTTNRVQQLQITTSMLVLPIQFEEDMP